MQLGGYVTIAMGASVASYCVTAAIYFLRPQWFAWLAVRKPALDDLAAIDWSSKPRVKAWSGPRGTVVRLRHPWPIPGRPVEYWTGLTSVLLISSGNDEIRVVSVTTILMLELVPATVAFALSTTLGALLGSMIFMLVAGLGWALLEPLWRWASENVAEEDETRHGE